MSSIENDTFFDQTREVAIHLPDDLTKAVVQTTLEAPGHLRNSDR